MKENERYFKLINKELLTVSRGNIRKTATGGSELAKSMRTRIALGLPPIREPLSVFWHEEKKKYEIWDGQKRFKAGLLVRIELFPCFIYPELTDEEEAKQYSLTHSMESENMCHLDMAEVISEELDRAGGYQQLIDKYGWTKRKLTAISKYRNISLGLSPKVKELIRRDIESTSSDFRHRKWSREVLYLLSHFKDHEQQEAVLKEYLRKAPKGRRAREFFDEKLEKHKQSELIETGLKITCSECGKQLSLIHKKTKGSHKLKEVNARQKTRAPEKLLVNVDA